MNQELRFLFCYDRELFDFLNKKGFKFITKARHYKSNMLFTLFHQSYELNLALEEWNNKNLNYCSGKHPQNT